MITFSQLGRMGRLANGMFSIAGTIGIAIKSGQSFCFPLWKNYDAVERFGSTEDIDVYKHFVNRLPEMPEGIQWQEYGYWWGYRQIELPQGNWDLGGHMQSEKYFSHCIDRIRHYFTMYDEVDYNATVLHLRFGDYDGNYHPLPDPEYYRKALEYIPLDSELYVFSDNNVEAYKLLAPITTRYFKIIDQDYLQSFKIMKRCKHFICGNSSYSLMAAILADQPGKIVICPKKWFGDHVGLETVDLYPEGSIVI